ncbi:hypothetical protein BSKO_03059 [Bryopsis sp. KO-2023]|nr:hypothetical protein BSKO_03059 [Bryopsis sp. KO-2023]
MVELERTSAKTAVFLCTCVLLSGILLCNVAAQKPTIRAEAEEDGGTVTAQLPADLFAEDFRAVCYPQQAEFFDVSSSGTVSYRPKDGAYSATPQDNLVTPFVEARVYIRPQNNAPIAAKGRGRLFFNKPQDILSPNTYIDDRQRMQLKSPYSLVGALVGEDPDGDGLTSTTAKEVDPGMAIRKTDHLQRRLKFGCKSRVVKLEKRQQTPSPCSYSDFWYEITGVPGMGTAEFLCDGKEVYDADTCSTHSDDVFAEPQAFYRYQPNSDGEGQDNFNFQMRIEGQSALAPSSGTIALNVLKINQAPKSFDADVNIPLRYSTQPFSRGGFAAVALKATDTDSNILLGLVDMNEFWSGAGQLFTDIGDGTVDTATPIDTIIIDNVPWGQVDIIDGEGPLYFLPIAGIAGSPLTKIVYKVFDGELYSDLATVSLNLECEPGFYAATYDGPNEPPAELDSLHSCYHCSPGTMSYIADQIRCTACDRGSYSTGGASSCTLCPSGFYQARIGAEDCEKCPEMSFSQRSSESINECYCEKGSYGQHGECRKCPDEEWVDCQDEGQTWPYPLDGYWVSGLSSGAARIRSCVPKDACIGLDRSADTVVPLAMDDIEKGLTCKKGYYGDGCSKCGSGYFRSLIHCEKCPGVFALLLHWMLYISILLLPLIIKVFGGTMHWMAFYVVVLFIHATALLGRYQIGWTREFRMYLEIISLLYLNIDFLRLECLGGSFTNFELKWWLLMLLPAFAAIISTTGAKYDTVPPLAVSQVPVSIGALMPFDCVEDPPTGKYFMEGAPYIQCYTMSGTWKKLFVPALLFICLYLFGIPALMIAVTAIIKRKSLIPSNNLYISFVFGFLRPGLSFSMLFPVISLMTLCLLTFGTSIGLESEMLRLVGAMLVMMVCHWMLLFNKPFTANTRMAFVSSLLVTSFSILALSAIIIGSPRSGEGINRLLFVANVLQITVIFVVSVCYLAWLLSPFCRDVELWLKNMWAEQQQLRKLTNKRRGRKKARSWKDTISRFKNMHSVVSVWRTDGKGMGMGAESKKGPRAQAMLDSLEALRQAQAPGGGRGSGGSQFRTEEERQRALISAQLTLEAMALTLLPAGQEAALELIKDWRREFPQEKIMRWFRHVLAYYKCTTELRQSPQVGPDDMVVQPFEDCLNPRIKSDLLEQMSRRQSQSDNRMYAAIMERIINNDTGFDNGIWNYGQAVEEQLKLFTEILDAGEDNTFVNNMLQEHPRLDEGSSGRSAG